MKKIIYLFLTACLIFIFENTANAILADQAPVKQSVLSILNTKEGEIHNRIDYGLNVEKFREYPMTQDTVQEIYDYIKSKIETYETRVNVYGAKADVDFNAGKIFYDFSIIVKSNKEIIKLPRYTVQIQPRHDI